jgi:hypothetical protein
MPEQIEAELEVEPQTVVDALRLDQTPGVHRKVVFFPDHTGEHNNQGKCRDVSDAAGWASDTPPITIRPEHFFDRVEDLNETKAIARNDARDHDEDPEECASEAANIWESNMHNQLKNMVTIPTYNGDIHYEITYVEDDQ